MKLQGNKTYFTYSWGNIVSNKNNKDGSQTMMELKKDAATDGNSLKLFDQNGIQERIELFSSDRGSHVFLYSEVTGFKTVELFGELGTPSIFRNGLEVIGNIKLPTTNKIKFGNSDAEISASSNNLILNAGIGVPGLVSLAGEDNLTVFGKVGLGTTNLDARLNISAVDNTAIISNVSQNTDYGYGILSKVNRDNTKAIAVQNNGVENAVIYGNGNSNFKGLMNIGPLGSGSNGLVLQSTNMNSPFVSWDNGTQKFSIRSDNSKLYIGTGDGSGFNEQASISNIGNFSVSSDITMNGKNLFMGSYLLSLHVETGGDQNNYLHINPSGSHPGVKVNQNVSRVFDVNSGSLRINENGSVGIGTTSNYSDVKMDIRGRISTLSSQDGGSLRMYNASNTGDYFEMFYDKTNQWGTFQRTLVPSGDGFADLGASNRRWGNLFLTGTAQMTGFKLITNDAGIGKVLTSDMNGNGAWSPLPISSQWTTSGSNIFYNTGNVGIGTDAPTELLHIANTNPLGNARVKIQGGTYGNASTDFYQGTSLVAAIGYDYVVGGLAFYENSANQMVIYHGRVGIGTTPTTGDYKLSVNGKVRAKEIIVEDNWSDYVFDNNYKLLELTEVENFIKQNKHLPGVPTAKEIESNGINLGKMQSKLLEKVEELTLYVIEMKKENENLKKRLLSIEQKTHDTIKDKEK
jgi:hypothetical protein